MVDFRIDVVVDPRGAVAGSRAVSRELTGMLNSADRLRTTLVSAFGIFGTGALIGNAIRTLAGFEQSIATVRAVTNATAEDFERLRQRSLDLGLTTQFSARQAADAMLDLSRAGFTVDETLVSVNDTLLLATAGGLDFASAADIAASSLRGFRLNADQMGRVADVLAETANKTNTSVQELGDALKFVAPIAASVGESFEETNAALGLLSNAGLKASLAGTGLKRVLSELEGPTTATRKKLEALGLSAADVRISQVGLVEALQRLKDAGLDAGGALEVFGDRGGPSFEILANAIPQLKELTTTLENSGGVAKRVADDISNNLGASIKFLGSAFESLILSIGNAGATNGLRGLIDGLASALRFLAGNADVLIKFVQNLALFLGPRYLVGAIRAVTLALAANPLGLLLTVIAAIIAAIPDFQNKLTGLIGTIGELASSITDGFDFSELLVGIGSAIDTTVAYFNGLLAAAGTVFDNIAAKPEAVREVIIKAFRDAAEAVLDIFLALFQTLGNLLTFFGRELVNVIGQSVISLRELAFGNLEGAQQAADSVTASLKGTVKVVGEFPQQFSNNLKKLRGVEILPEVELSQQAFDIGNQVSQAFQEGIESSTPTAADSIERLLGKDLAGEAQKRVEEAAKNLPKTQAEPFKPPPIPLSDRASDILNQIEATKELLLQESALQEIYDQRPELLGKLNEVFLSAQIAALESSTSMADGFTRAFLKIQQEAQNFAAASEAVVNAFADRATDAIVNFTKTGELNFKEFAVSVLEEITRILVRLLIVQAISAAVGLAGGGAATINTGTNLALNNAGGGGGRAKGGTVQPDRSYVVGENGPEIFQPGKTGTIVPNSAPAAPPQVNVQVVNVDDPKKVPQAITSGEADEAIINALARNKDRVSQVIK